MFNITIVLFGVFSTVSLIFILIFVVFNVRKMSQLVIWFILGISISIGFVIGYFMTKIAKIGVCIIGCWTGLLFAIILDSFTFNKMGITFMIYILALLFISLFGFLAYRYYGYVLIISSSILGSYFLVRGVSLILGGYPNETDLLNHSSIPWSFYLYVVIMVVLSITGVVMQVKKLAKYQKKGNFLQILLFRVPKITEREEKDQESTQN